MQNLILTEAIMYVKARSIQEDAKKSTLTSSDQHRRDSVIITQLQLRVARVPAGFKRQDVVGKEDNILGMFQFFRRCNVSQVNKKGRIV